MTLVDLDEGTAGRLKPGDTVHIRGTVVQARGGVGVQVELFSKTDQYTAWVQLGDVVALVLPDVPPEPGDGTWIPARDDDGGVNVFHRCDAEAPDEPDRRFPRRWQVAGTGEWVDWATAVHRGADTDQRLNPAGKATLRDEVVRVLSSSNRRRGMTLAEIAARISLAALVEPRPALEQVRQVLEQLLAEDLVTHRSKDGSLLPRWAWKQHADG